MKNPFSDIVIWSSPSDSKSSSCIPQCHLSNKWLNVQQNVCKSVAFWLETLQQNEANLKIQIFFVMAMLCSLTWVLSTSHVWPNCTICLTNGIIFYMSTCVASIDHFWIFLILMNRRNVFCDHVWQNLKHFGFFNYFEIFDFFKSQHPFIDFSIFLILMNPNIVFCDHVCQNFTFWICDYFEIFFSIFKSECKVWQKQGKCAYFAKESKNIFATIGLQSWVESKTFPTSPYTTPNSKKKFFLADSKTLL